MKKTHIIRLEIELYIPHSEWGAVLRHLTDVDEVRLKPWAGTYVLGADRYATLRGLLQHFAQPFQRFAEKGAPKSLKRWLKLRAELVAVDLRRSTQMVLLLEQ